MYRYGILFGVFLIAVVSVSSVALAVEPGDDGPAGPDTWYYDMQGHWSEQYTLTLWKEGVTNGYPFPVIIPGQGWQHGYNFQPDNFMTRGQLLLMMSKLFKLDPDYSTPTLWPDLPPTFTLYGRPAYGPIRAAALAWDLASNGGALELTRTVSRLDAVEFIMSALNLLDYPENLTESQVESILTKFADGDQIPINDRKMIAASIDLGLLIGYHDNTLRIDELMTRAEGATILYRSCLMRVIPAYSIFYPDGDGYRENLPIETETLQNTAINSWGIVIETQNGKPLAHLPSESPTAGDPEIVYWSGRDDVGDKLPPGIYFVGGYVIDHNDNEFAAVRIPVELSKRQLSSEVDPPEVSINEHFMIRAYTQGEATGISVALPGGNSHELFRGETLGKWRAWERQIRASNDHGFEPGNIYDLHITAQYHNGKRQDTSQLKIAKVSDPENEEEDQGAFVPVLIR